MRIFFSYIFVTFESLRGSSPVLRQRKREFREKVRERKERRFGRERVFVRVF